MNRSIRGARRLKRFQDKTGPLGHFTGPVRHRPLNGLRVVVVALSVVVVDIVAVVAIPTTAYASTPTWSTQTIPTGVGVLDGISCASSTKCEAFGENSSGASDILGTANGGTTWTAQTVPTGVGAVLGISCASTTTCEAVGQGSGASSAILGTTNGGTTWTAQTAPSGTDILEGISCASTTACEAVGFNATTFSGVILGTTNGGTTWDAQTVPEGVGNLGGVSCALPTTCEAVGGDYTGSWIGFIVGTTNGGTTWTSQALPSGVGELEGISCASSTTCEAVGGDSNDTTGVVLASANSGTTWTAQTVPSGVGVLSGVSCVSTTGCEAVGSNSGDSAGVALGTADDGTTWTTQTVPSGAESLIGISCLSASLCSAVGAGVTRPSGVILTYRLPPLSITTNSLPGALVGSAYSASLAATGGTAPFTWSITSASPPSWLNLDPSTGALSGTAPATPSEVSITFEVTDSEDPAAVESKTLAIDVQIPPAAGGLAPLTPARIMNTRSNLGADGPMAADSSISLQVLGVGGVPATGVSAVVLNVTVTQPKANGYLTVYPDGVAQPTTSSLNFSAGETVPNLVIAPVGSDGKVDFYNGSSGTVQVIADVSGWFASGSPAAGGLAPLTPARIMNTRSNLGADGPMAADSSISLQVLGVGGVPATGVSAVVLNVTVTQPKANGYLTVYPDGVAQPTTSSLNFSAGETVPNLVIAPVGSDGKVDFYNGSSGTVQVIADVSGWFASGSPAAGGLAPLTPARIMNTRSNLGADGPMAADSSISLQVLGVGGVPATGVSAVVLNVTVTQPKANGYLTVYPDGVAQPTTSSLNFSAGETVPNLVIAPVGSDGKVDFYNGSSGTVQVIADVSGWLETP